MFWCVFVIGCFCFEVVVLVCLIGVVLFVSVLFHVCVACMCVCEYCGVFLCSCWVIVLLRLDDVAFVSSY